MANKMLIDATHPEETRVVVLRGNRVEEFDFESASRRQLRGNIYLAKVTRVEPSLQAAFVDYGGNRHGFLAFSEIHPDYYQIPVADRQALIAEEERAHRDAEDEIDRRASGGGGGRRRRGREHGRRDETRTQALDDSHEESQDDATPAEAVDAEQAGEVTEPATADQPDTHQADVGGSDAPVAAAPQADAALPESVTPPVEAPIPVEDAKAAEQPAELPAPEPTVLAQVAASEPHDTPAAATDASALEPTAASDEPPATTESPELAPEAGANGDTVYEGGGNITEIEEPAHAENGEEEIVESVGGADALEEVQERTPRYRRSYKIQEVIKRRQIMLVQVVKEERGTKGAALTTYLSLAGRYSVLMPNTARGGGISRKITNAVDRKKLKEIAQDLEVPEGMGVILRTAGAARTKTEVKRDFEYLLRLWETVRDFTLRSTAPMLVYEEGSLIKRSIRDLYNKDIEEILVAGDAGHREAKDFMRMLMPSHAKNVKSYKDTQPVFTRYGIESQLDAMFTPTVQLRSGGYIVLNQTEALVAIDVNSGRATREHHIEDTALKTNCEAAEEIARQLRLRDLAGLIVIDFIDMDENRNNRTVERRLKDALKNDRARIQVGRISHFGLMEMSRQRIRSSVLESSTDKCPHCGGTGHVRSVSSVTLHLLRMIEEMLLKGATHNLIVRTRTEVALYALNHKRAHLRDLESRFQITITINADASVGAAQPFLIEKGEQVHSVEAAKALLAQAVPAPTPAEEDEDEAYEEEIEEEAAEDIAAPGRGEAGRDEAETEAEAAPEGAEGEAGEQPRRRRRRRGRGRGGDRDGERPPREDFARPAGASETGDEAATAGAGDAAGEAAEGEESGRTGEGGDGDDRRRRRRGRRGGRRNRRGRDGEGEGAYAGGPNGSDQPHEADGIEPEVADAVADLGGPIRTPDEPRQDMGHEPQLFEPVAPAEPRGAEARDAEPRTDEPRGAEPQPAETRAAEGAPVEAHAEAPPKRRSTVREPAPMFSFSAGSMSDVQPVPPTQSVAAQPETVPPPPAPPEPVAETPPAAEASPPAEATSPAEANSPAEATEQPKRRFGWWSRRG
jgi:ribonuclease E